MSLTLAVVTNFTANVFSIFDDPTRKKSTPEISGENIAAPHESIPEEVAAEMETPTETEPHNSTTQALAQLADAEEKTERVNPAVAAEAKRRGEEILKEATREGSIKEYDFETNSKRTEPPKNTLVLPENETDAEETREPPKPS